MGSCSSKQSNIRPSYKINRETVMPNDNSFTNPQIRAKIFSAKDSKAPVLILKVNSLWNKRKNASSNLATQMSES